ncbi:hypothetical protein [Pelomonas cellulosilytica]|uniref:YqjK-like protein n=1 Tax=Pelomonas cellulosilytica TaxID=2906762 RepID=A0ABS8XYI0_9BURK|nr:hypothetical protein [Pelomonas sp. P8]MCE4555681.1 hypothetical protein [Pelomonas sp. P8]
MIPRIPQDPALRTERKENLLLASTLLRGQMERDLDDLGERADGVARRVQVLRGWLKHPALQALVGGGAAFFATADRQRRHRLWGLLRWGWLAWRVWRRR